MMTSYSDDIAYFPSYEIITGIHARENYNESDLRNVTEAGVAKVGLEGFCMGGKVAYMAAARSDVDASVGYYGVGLDQMLNESHAIANPLMLHVPTADGFVPPEAQAAMHAGLDDNAHVTIHDYPGLDHGFADTFGARRDADGAKLAEKRTAEFFAAHVG